MSRHPDEEKDDDNQTGRRPAPVSVARVPPEAAAEGKDQKHNQERSATSILRSLLQYGWDVWSSTERAVLASPIVTFRIRTLGRVALSRLLCSRAPSAR